MKYTDNDYKVTEKQQTIAEIRRDQQRMLKVYRRRIKQGYEPRTKTLFQ